MRKVWMKQGEWEEKENENQQNQRKNLRQIH